MSESKPTPTELMNKAYKARAKKFSEDLDNEKTDNILLYMMQRTPMKVNDPCTPQSHRTFNILYCYIGIRPEKAHEKIPPWVDTHLDWVKEVTSTLLEQKNCKFQNFIDEWLHGSFPLDEAGILIIARPYKIHVAVFFNDFYWSTAAAKDLNLCKVFLVYRGSLVFHDTRRLLTDEYNACRDKMKQLQKYYEGPKVNTTLARMRECQRKAKEAAKSSTQNHIPSDSTSSDNDSSSSSSLDKTKCAMDDNSVAANGQERNQNIMPVNTAGTEGEQNIMPSNEDATEEEHETNIMPSTETGMEENIMCHADTEDNLDLEQMMEMEKTPSEGNHSDVPEEDANGQNSESSPEDERSDSNAGDDPQGNASASSSEGEESTSEDSSDTTYMCEYSKCGETFDSEKELKKHEQKHKGKRSKDGRIHCDMKGCSKHYGTKRALQRHKKNNHDKSGKWSHCTERTSHGKDCIKNYPTQQQLDQHVRGVHREGFHSYCGKRFTWPLDRHRHQQECTKCEKLMKR